MDSSKVKPEEIEKAKQMLEEHRSKGNHDISVLAITLAALSILGAFLFVATKNDALLFSPLLPVIFGIVGLSRSVSTRGKTLAGLAILVGVLVFIILLALS